MAASGSQKKEKKPTCTEKKGVYYRNKPYIADAARISAGVAASGGGGGGESLIKELKWSPLYMLD